MRIGNTPREVSEFLAQGYLPLGPSQFERAHFGITCPRCEQESWLCVSESGLPASSPHIERTLAAVRESEI